MQGNYEGTIVITLTYLTTGCNCHGGHAVIIGVWREQTPCTLCDCIVYTFAHFFTGAGPAEQADRHCLPAVCDSKNDVLFYKWQTIFIPVGL